MCEFKKLIFRIETNKQKTSNEKRENSNEIGEKPKMRDK